MLAVAAGAVAFSALRWLVSLGPDITAWTRFAILMTALLFTFPIDDRPAPPHDAEELDRRASRE
jgi:hypothetical protein